VFVCFIAKISDWFLQQWTNIKFCVKLGKLLLEMKYGAFNMMLKANSKVPMETVNIPVTQESLPIKITNEDNTYDFP
jgi:hypothetical protein